MGRLRGSDDLWRSGSVRRSSPSRILSRFQRGGGRGFIICKSFEITILMTLIVVRESNRLIEFGAYRAFLWPDPSQFLKCSAVKDLNLEGNSSISVPEHRGVGIWDYFLFYGAPD